MVTLAPVFPIQCQTGGSGFMSVRGWLLGIFWCVYAVSPDFPVEMNGRVTEDKSEYTDCDGSSLPEDFSEVGWQEAGRCSFNFFLYQDRTGGNNMTCPLNKNITVDSSFKWYINIDF